MATVHVLDRVGTGYRCVIHFATPAGSNSASVTWKAAAIAAKVTGVASRLPATAVPGPGEVSTTENTSLLAGDTAEFEAVIEAETGGATGALLGAMVDAEAVKLIAAYQTKLQAELKWYGATRT